MTYDLKMKKKKNENKYRSSLINRLGFYLQFVLTFVVLMKANNFGDVGVLLLLLLLLLICGVVFEEEELVVVVVDVFVAVVAEFVVVVADC